MALSLALAGCGAVPPAGTPEPTDLASLQTTRGAERYEVLCAGCHGGHAAGTEQGPPLVHALYNRGHHRDSAFRRAVSDGVQAHHWPFGDMPPIPQATAEDTTDIIGYVRALQRAAGIY